MHNILNVFKVQQNVRSKDVFVHFWPRGSQLSPARHVQQCKTEALGRAKELVPPVTLCPCSLCVCTETDLKDEVADQRHVVPPAHLHRLHAAVRGADPRQ